MDAVVGGWLNGDEEDWDEWISTYRELELDALSRDDL